VDLNIKRGGLEEERMGLKVLKGLKSAFTILGFHKKLYPLEL